MNTKKIIALAIMVLMPFKALAADDAFTIRNIEISSTAEDPATAKIKAIEAGEAEAYKVLLDNLGVEGGTLRNLDPKDISALVGSYQVQNEKISGGNYRAALIVSFSPEMIKNLTRRQNFAPHGSLPTFIVVPLIYEDDKPLLFGQQNNWISAWRGGAKGSRSLQLVVPAGDSEDAKIITPADVVGGNYNALAALARKYGVRNMVVAIAKPYNGSLAVSLLKIIDGNTARQDFTFPLPDAPGPEFLNGVVSQLTIYLEKISKEPVQGKPETLVSQPRLNIQVSFRDIAEWIAIKDKISKIDSLTKMEINELGTNSANINVYLQPNIKDVNSVFLRYGMALEDVGGGRFALVNMPPQAAIPQNYRPLPQNMPNAPEIPQAAPPLGAAERTPIKDTPIKDSTDDDNDILKAAAAERSKQEMLNSEARAMEKRSEGIAADAPVNPSAADEPKSKQP